MSLADSLKSFHAERGSAVSRNLAHSRPAATTSNTPARSSTPKPPATSTTMAPAAAAGEMMQTVLYAIDKLKKQEGHTPMTFDALVAYLSLPNDMPATKLRRALQGHPRLEFIPAAQAIGGKESFRYKPLHPATNGEELRTYLEALAGTEAGARGLPVKELRDGWPDCLPTLEQLESEAHILLLRNKKDGSPKTVYPDNSTYYPTPASSNPPNTKGTVDPEFVDFYTRVRLPANENDIRIELEKAGLTPTSAVKEVRKVETKKRERKRVERKNAKKTNTHMLGVLKDYSKLKPGGR